MDTAPPPDPATNIPEYTVSEISGAVKRTLEGAFGRVRVRGEVTEFKRYPSGHIYFSLKDEGGKIAGVVWKSAVSRLGLLPENGVEVIATGRVSSYGDRSSYQLVVERMEYAGVGALLARIEMLRARLAAEGLFDASRKRPLPLLPGVVGIVTSAAGAVLHDIRTTVARRFPRRLLVWPVPVQGEGAAERIARAIAGFDGLTPDGPVPRPDVLIVARGGGSLEDLMAFNDELVLRAAASCRIPLISAVGHETDHTLIDLVSDRRAPTPTAAAELAVPSRTELVANLAQEAARLAGALHRITQERRLRLGRAERGLPDAPGLLGGARQRLDDRGQRLVLALPNLVARRRSSLANQRLPAPAAIPAPARAAIRLAAAHLSHALAITLARPRDATARARLSPAPLEGALREARARLKGAAAHLSHALTLTLARPRDATARARLSPAPLEGALREARARLDGAAGRLSSVSPEAVLARGYALVTDAAGHPVAHAAAIRPGARLSLQFMDGPVRVTADPRPGPTRPAATQRTLPL